MPHPPTTAIPPVRASRYGSMAMVATGGRCRARNWPLLLVVIAASWVGPVAVSRTSAITIEWNYEYDTNGFFSESTGNGLAARTTLEFAGRVFEPFADLLEAIEPVGTNQWTATTQHPGTGGGLNVPGPTIPEGTLLIFAGGSDLRSSQVGLGGPGGFSASGSSSFLKAVTNRGLGNTPTDDFGPWGWGGSISFDTNNLDGSLRDWHFDISGGPSLGQKTDFLSVAMHELGHLFGFGIAGSFDQHVDAGGTTFTGNVPGLTDGGVSVNGGHWASGTTSPPYVEGSRPFAAMGSSLLLGTRNVFTPLDYASLKDTGWGVPDMLLGLPGDSDGDLDVDGADFLRWQRGLGMTAGALPTDGDLDGDGDVDPYDGWIVHNNLGAIGAVSSLELFMPVPEPASGLLLALAAAWMIGVSGCRNTITCSGIRSIESRPDSRLSKSIRSGLAI